MSGSKASMRHQLKRLFSLSFSLSDALLIALLLDLLVLLCPTARPTTAGSYDPVPIPVSAAGEFHTGVTLCLYGRGQVLPGLLHEAGTVQYGIRHSVTTLPDDGNTMLCRTVDVVTFTACFCSCCCLGFTLWYMVWS